MDLAGAPTNELSRLVAQATASLRTWEQLPKVSMSLPHECPVLNEYPGLTRSEYREMLRVAKQSGPGPWPWHLIALFVACLLLLGSYQLLTFESHWSSLFSVVLLAIGMLLLQILLHEAAHDSFVRRHWGNVLIGWLAGLWVLTPFASYHRGHAAHHRFAGTPRDPTAAPDAPKWHQGLVNGLVKLRVVPVLYLGGVYVPYLIYDLRSSSGTRRLMWFVNLLAIAMLHAMLAWVFGPLRYGLVLVMAFWGAAVLYEYLFTQHQHVGLLPIPQHKQRYLLREQQLFSRSVRVPCAGLLMFFNLHKEHHLFPGLPCRYLPCVHDWLQQNRPDLLDFTSDHLGILQRRSDLKLYEPTEGDLPV